MTECSLKWLTKKKVKDYLAVSQQIDNFAPRKHNFSSLAASSGKWQMGR